MASHSFSLLQGSALRPSRRCVLHLGILLFLVSFAGILVTPARTSPQLPTEEWLRAYVGPEVDQSMAIKVDASGNSYVTVISAVAGVPGMVTLSYDSAGALRWEQRYVGPGGASQPSGLALDGIGNVYVTGIALGDASHPTVSETVSYTSAGAFRWAQHHEAPPGYTVISVGLGVDASGNVYVSDYAYNSTGTESDFLTLSYDTNGTLRWSQSNPHPAGTLSFATAMVVDSSGNSYIGGAMVTPAATLVKYTSTGQLDWVSSIEGNQASWNSVAVDLNGNVYVTGYSQTPTGRKAKTQAMAPNGSTLWGPVFIDTANSLGEAIVADGAGNAYVSATVPGSTGTDLVTVSYNGGGSQRWVHTVDPPGSAGAVPNAIVRDTSGNVVVLGTDADGAGVTRGVILSMSEAGQQRWLRTQGASSNDTNLAYRVATGPGGKVYLTGWLVSSTTSIDTYVARLGEPTTPPGLSVIGNQDTLEDVLKSIPFSVIDDYIPVDDLDLTASSSVPGLVQSFAIVGSGSNRTLQIQPAPNQNGSANITLQASNGLFSASRVFQLTVSPVNDAPSFTKGADQTVNEDAGAQTVPGWATSISAGPTADELTQTLTFLVSSTNSTLFSSAPAITAAGALTYIPSANKSGFADVTVRLMDNGGAAGGGADTSAPQTFRINVNAVNDAPSFSAGVDLSVNVDAGPQSVTGWATNLSAGPADEAGQSLTFIVTPTNPTLFSTAPAINAAGKLTFTAGAGQSGFSDVSVRLQDNGGSDNGGVDTSAPQTSRITVLATPTSLTAEGVSDAQINLAWHDGSSSETGFRIERKGPAEPGFTLLTDVAANVVSYQDHAVLDGSQYAYRVRFLTAGSPSAPSNEAVATTLLSTPTGLDAISLPGDAVLFWSDNSVRESGFEIQRKLVGGAFALYATEDSDTQAYLDDDLVPGSSYVYRVRAFNSVAVSNWSNEAGTAPGAGPAMPTGLTALQAGPTDVKLNWTDGSSDEAGFEIRSKPGNAAAPGTYQLIATVVANRTTFTDTGLTPGATYTYQVTAVNGSGSSAPAGPAMATLTVDTVKPTLTLTGTRSGPPVQVDVTARDTGSGLAEIQVLVSDNCTISFAPFTPGTTSPVLVTATKTNPAIAARVVLRARDLAGNSLDGDPVITELVIPARQNKVVKSFTGLPAVESWLTIENDTPGLKKLVVTVNKARPLSYPLRNGQKREADLAARMQPGDGNTIKLMGHGKPGARALVIIADPPAPGGKSSVRVQWPTIRSTTRLNLDWHR